MSSRTVIPKTKTALAGQWTARALRALSQRLLKSPTSARVPSTLPLFPDPVLIRMISQEALAMKRMDSVERSFLSVVALSFLLLVASITAMALN